MPKVDFANGRIIGAEALLRWTDAEHGSVPPQVFIPLAEESGLIHALGEWVLKTAAAQCVAWRKAGMQLNVSVNLSARQFYREDLAQRISDIVKTEKCDPSWIELEVTETSLLHDLDAIRKALHLLRKDGPDAPAVPLPGPARPLLAVAELRDLDLRQRNADEMLPLLADHLTARDVLTEVGFHLPSDNLAEALDIMIDLLAHSMCLYFLV